MSEDKAPGIGTLRSNQSTEDIEPLLRELRDFNDQTRERAATRLGEIGDARSTQALIGRLRNDKTLRVQWLAAEALYRIGDPQAWPSIVEKLRSSNNIVGAKCAEILGNIGDKRFAEPLVEALRFSESQVTEQAIISLGKIKSESVVPKIIEYLKKDGYYGGNKSNYIQALVSMGEMVTREVLNCANSKKYSTYSSSREPEFDDINLLAVFQGIGPAIVPIIADKFKEQSDDVRLLGTKAVSSIDNDQSTQLLCQIIQQDPKEDVRRTTLSAIEKRSSDLVTSTLIYVLNQDASLELRKIALDALERIPSLKVIDALILVLREDSTHIDIRKQTAQILGKFKAIQALPELCIIASQSKFNVAQQEAIKSLGLLQDAKAVVALGPALLDDVNSKTRTLAANAIGMIGVDEGIEYLLSALGSDGDEAVRIEAANALGKSKGNKIIEPLKIVANNDPSEKVKEAARLVLRNSFNITVGAANPPIPAPQAKKRGIFG